MLSQTLLEEMWTRVAGSWTIQIPLDGRGVALSRLLA